MGALSDFLENRVVDGAFRGGCLTTSGAAGSSSVVKGIRTASTVYAVGDIVVPESGDTGAGGKLLMCTTAGTSAASGVLAIPNPGSTIADGTVTWTAIATLPAFLNLNFAIATCSKGIVARSTLYALNDTAVVSAVDGKYHLYKVTTGGTTAGSAPSYPGAIAEVITDGTAVLTEQSNAMDAGTAVVEPSGGSYARVAQACSLANFAGTQSAGSTTASSGTGATTSNNGAITWPTPSGAWASGSVMAWAVVVYDQLTGGNLVTWAPLSAPKTINSTDPAPSVAIGSFTLQLDS